MAIVILIQTIQSISTKGERMAVKEPERMTATTSGDVADGIAARRSAGENTVNY